MVWRFAMHSPFPGMDPYLEHQNFWSDFHNNLASEIQARLNQQILPSYVARTTRYVTYDVLEISAGHEAKPNSMYPDVSVWQSSLQPDRSPLAIATITPAPVESVVLQEVPFRQHNIEIRQTETKKLVTVIEILSPVNKREGHEAHKEYLNKRRNILRTEVHLLELDLLRAGTRPPLERPVPAVPYYITLCRGDRRPIAEVWPIQLADPLPVLPVPLLEPDPDVPLDLGQAVASVYERGAYWVEIDYNQPPPPPPLSEAELVWLNERLRQVEVRD